MSLELLVFLIVAAIAIFASAFMLASRNAVHSALFLVITMICLAFFYLILNAPFLAMVQITVYAGAIMVLFLFVIMLLGSTKLDTPPTRYRWLSVGAVGLAALFMITAFVAVVQGNVDLLQPIPPPSQVRVLDTAPGGPLTFYAGNTLLAANLTADKVSDYVALPKGTYTLNAFAAKADGSPIDLANDKPLLTGTLSLGLQTTATLVATADRLIAAREDLTTLGSDGQFRYVAVDALPGDTVANLLQVDPANSSNAQVAAPHLNYGQTSDPKVLPAGTYTFVWEVNGQRTAFYAGQPITADNTQLYVLASDPTVKGQTIALQFSQRTNAAFGSPEQIGQQLFSGYLLPFELVSLLLLAAMVGAIVLTREEWVRRERKRVIVSPGAARLNQAADALAIRATSPVNGLPVASAVNPNPQSESAAD